MCHPGERAGHASSCRAFRMFPTLSDQSEFWERSDDLGRKRLAEMPPLEDRRSSGTSLKIHGHPHAEAMDHTAASCKSGDQVDIAVGRHVVPLELEIRIEEPVQT